MNPLQRHRRVLFAACASSIALAWCWGLLSTNLGPVRAEDGADSNSARPRIFGGRPNSPPSTGKNASPPKTPPKSPIIPPAPVAPVAPPPAIPPAPPNENPSDENGASAGDSESGKKLKTESNAPLVKPSVGSAKPAPVPTNPTSSAETLFEGWQKPSLALVISGDQWGYIEPCGCTGLANQKGGLARRHTFIKQLEEKGWPLAPIDVGNQVRRFGRQAEIKFQTTAHAMKDTGYVAVGFGPDDLRLSFGELVAAIVATDPKHPTPFISANIDFADLVPLFRVISVGGKRIGITAVIGSSYASKVANGDLTITRAETALNKVQAELRKQKCDLYVLLSHCTAEESKVLAEKFPWFNVVVTAGIYGEPTREAEELNDKKTLLVQTGNKGMYVGVIGLFDNPKQPLLYQRVPLDARYPDSQPMLDIFKGYQRQLEMAGLSGLEITARRHPSGHTFVGSEACADCHTKAYKVWKDSPHAKATDSIVTPGERSEIPRHFDPECLSCHVTGWNPQQNYPYISGYLDLKKTPLLKQNGCENCHGPGSAHVAAENDDAPSAVSSRAKFRAEMVLPLAKAEQHCMECHDLDNSPDFHARGAFEKYWSRIEHKGKD